MMRKTLVPFPNCLKEICNSPFYYISCTCKKKKRCQFYFIGGNKSTAQRVQDS